MNFMTPDNTPPPTSEPRTLFGLTNKAFEGVEKLVE